MKNIKNEIYKHGSYLYSLKEADFQTVSIDSEIEKMEELHQITSTGPTVDQKKIDEDDIIEILNEYVQAWCSEELTSKTEIAFAHKIIGLVS